MATKKFGSATGRDLYLDVPLSNALLGYRPTDFVGDMLFPIIPVSKQSGSIIEFSQADAFRVEDMKRAPDTEAKRVTWGVSSQMYYCNNYALAAGVTIEDRANADPIYASRLIEGRGQRLLDKLMLGSELRIMSLVGSTSNVGSSSAVTSIWNIPEGDGNPILDLNTAIDNVQFASGYRPNTLLFGLKAWNALRRHKNARNLVFGVNNGGGYLNTAQVGNLFEIETVIVARSFRNTAEENLAAAYSNAFRSDAVLACYVNRQPSQENPSFGYSYRWSAPGIPSLQVERHPYDPKRKSEAVEVGFYQDEVITGSRFGFLVTSCA